jgi:hypothetical protein
MGKWLARLPEFEKKRNTLRRVTDKTDETGPGGVLSVLSVHSGCVPEFFSGRSVSPEEEAAARFDELAGILEYDHHLPREVAERLAHLQINSTIH